MINVLIIDDEFKARNLLRLQMEKLIPEITGIETADSVDTAIELLKRFTPDVVFLDVEMPYKNGFRLLAEIGIPTFDVIFTTAFNQYAIQAIRFSALDYLLKPVHPEELIGAMQRHIEKKSGKQVQAGLYQNLVENIHKKDVKDFKIAVPSAEGYYFFMIEDILRLEADKNYTHIHLINKKPFIASKTLKHFQDMLESFNFIRTHKSHLVNPRYVCRVSSNNEFMLLTDGSKIEISRRKKEEVHKQLCLRA